jgi:hypothetical protein
VKQTSNRTAWCSDCGELVEEPAQIKDREPCPSCGSLARRFELTLTATVQVHGRIGLKARHGDVGKVKPHLEQTSGDDFHRDSGEWRQLSRVIDREHDRYTERIIDAAGDVVREIDEPLSGHRGHGAAKRQRQTDRQP